MNGTYSMWLLGYVSFIFHLCLSSHPANPSTHLRYPRDSHYMAPYFSHLGNFYRCSKVLGRGVVLSSLYIHKGVYLPG
ncbi:hypothetical protein GGR51DRAFT_507192 [Nemania sp. FL0031]|nr:hypothetical protein GGR51DRAFT_507192 [Nemania sp. FL0031]